MQYYRNWLLSACAYSNRRQETSMRLIRSMRCNLLGVCINNNNYTLVVQLYVLASDAHVGIHLALGFVNMYASHN